MLGHRQDLISNQALWAQTWFAGSIDGGTPHVVTIAGNYVDAFPINTSVQIAQGASLIYRHVLSSSFGAGSTTVTLRSSVGVLGNVSIRPSALGNEIFIPHRLGTGTPTNNNYLRGDGVWASVAATNYPPLVGFSHIATGLSVAFTNLSLDVVPGTIVKHWWDFGNGKKSHDVNPSVNYATAGTYVVTLMCIDDGGLSALIYQNVTVSVPVSADPPTANYTYSVAGLTVTFTDTSSDPNGNINAWAWDFGDGNTSTVQNPSHTYATGGTRNVSLTVTDATALSDSETKSIITNVNDPPVAGFNWSASGLGVTFVNTSTDPNSNITGYAWTFGDGGTSTATNPTHTYASDGSYTVTLTATDSTALTDDFSTTVSVVAGGGGGGCVAPTSFVTATQTAADVVPGDFIKCMTSPGVFTELEVVSNRRELQPCVRLSMKTGASLLISMTTPVTLKDGSLMMVSELINGIELPVEYDSKPEYPEPFWDTIDNIEYLGYMEVCLISVGGHCYAAGEFAGAYIYTHNMSSGKE